MRYQSTQKRYNYLDHTSSNNRRIELPPSSNSNRFDLKKQILSKSAIQKPKYQFLKQQCLKQNKKFQQWARKGCWEVFHSSHYDWWAFPIDSSSGSKGTAYKVGQKDQMVLQQDQQFLRALKQNAILVCKSWGWDLEKGEELKQKSPQQRWQKWPIRLSKMCRSLEIFKAQHEDMDNLFKNAISYAVLLLNKQKKFSYGGRDLTQYFLEKNFEIMNSRQDNQKKQEVKKEEEHNKILDQKQKQENLKQFPDKTTTRPSYSCSK